MTEIKTATSPEVDHLADGGEHFREAARIADASPDCFCEQTGCVHEQVQLARGQIHATLALAAFTALRGVASPGSQEHPFAGSGESCEVCGYTVMAKYVPESRFIHPEGNQ